jgi:hypothetical protein
MWEWVDSLLGEIKNAWESSGQNMQNMGYIASSLRDVMSSLKRWSQVNFGVVTKELAGIRESLDALSMQDLIANQGRITELGKRMDELLYREEMLWIHKSRVTWLKEGDRNTKFFHKKVCGTNKEK